MERGPTLPGVEDADDEDRIVLHVDLDCFYAACERLREPELEGEPVVVGMGYEPGEPDGAVATASYEARAHGVESAQAISTALERLPRAAASEAGADDSGASDVGDSGASDVGGSGVSGAEESDDEPVGYYRPVDMAYYETVAEDVKAILHDSAATVREVSIDEAYLDVTERTDWSVAEGYARHVKQRVEREVGLVASVGVAPTMHAAKVASDHDKPDGLVVVEPGEVESFLAPLPVDDLHGIGPVTARTLREHDVETVAQLADADREWVRERWGERGLELHDRARGRDPRSVEPRGLPKSLSRESAFADPAEDPAAVRERLRALAGAVADRARSKDAMYRTIGIKVVLPPYDVNTRERSLSGPVDDPDLVERVALDLHEEFADERPRKVGVRVSNLQFGAADQSTLGGWDGASAGGEGGDAAGDENEVAGEEESGASDEDCVAGRDCVAVDEDDGAGDGEDVAGDDGTDAVSGDGSTADAESSAAPPTDGPATGHVLGLDFGEDAGTGSAAGPTDADEPGEQAGTSEAGHANSDVNEHADGESAGATGPETAAASSDRDAVDAASDGAADSTAVTDATGATAAESTDGSVLDLDAGRREDSSLEGSAAEASTGRSPSAGSDADPGSGQLSLGSIADAVEDDAATDAVAATDGDATAGDAVDADDATAGDATDGDDGLAGTGGSDSGEETPSPSNRPFASAARPDDLPPEQTTLLDFWNRSDRGR